MKEKKDCMFQFADGDGNIFHDTDLITRSEGEKLFEDNTEKFKKLFLDGREPEMALWVDCKNNSDYSKHHWFWSYLEMGVVDGRVYQLGTVLEFTKSEY